MVAMKPIIAPDRCNARVKRLAQVKFVCLQLEPPPPSETARRASAGFFATIRDSLIRVIGCLEAARP